MKLLLHISEFASPSDKASALDWLERNQWSVENDWLDCTRFANLFEQATVENFCLMMCEFSSVDMIFDEWKITF